MGIETLGKDDRYSGPGGGPLKKSHKIQVGKIAKPPHFREFQPVADRRVLFPRRDIFRLRQAVVYDHIGRLRSERFFRDCRFPKAGRAPVSAADAAVFAHHPAVFRNLGCPRLLVLALKKFFRNAAMNMIPRQRVAGIVAA